MRLEEFVVTAARTESLLKLPAIRRLVFLLLLLIAQHTAILVAQLGYIGHCRTWLTLLEWTWEANAITNLLQRTKHRICRSEANL